MGNFANCYGAGAALSPNGKGAGSPTDNPATHVGAPSYAPSAGGVAAERPAPMADLRAYLVPMSEVAPEYHAAARVAAGVAMRKLGLRSLEIRWFANCGATARTMGFVQYSDDGVIYVKRGMSLEDTAATILHEAKHLGVLEDVLAMVGDGKIDAANLVEEQSEDAANHFEMETLPEWKLQHFEMLDAGPLAWGTKAR